MTIFFGGGVTFNDWRVVDGRQCWCCWNTSQHLKQHSVTFNIQLQYSDKVIDIVEQLLHFKQGKFLFVTNYIPKVTFPTHVNSLNLIWHQFTVSAVFFSVSSVTGTTCDTVSIENRRCRLRILRSNTPRWHLWNVSVCVSSALVCYKPVKLWMFTESRDLLSRLKNGKQWYCIFSSWGKV